MYGKTMETLRNKINKKIQKTVYVIIKDFNKFMYDHTVHRGRNHFCHFFLQAFSTAEALKIYVNDCFKNNGKQMIKMPKKINMFDSIEL